MKKVAVIGSAVIGGVVSAVPAFAIDLFTVPSVDVTLLGSMITGILAALALLWGARKAVKMINRS